MNLNPSQALLTLFKQGEGVCFGRHFKDTRVQPLTQSLVEDVSQFEFFCINPLLIDRDLEPPEWGHPDVGRRAGVNVTTFRSFLIECDKGSLDEQREYIDRLQIPYCMATYSGSKSIHFVVSLQNDVTSEEWVAAAERLAVLIKGADRKALTDRVRFSRMPSHIRKDKGREQSLVFLDINRRPTLEDLNKMLDYRGANVPTYKRILGPRKIYSRTDDGGIKMPEYYTDLYEGRTNLGTGERHAALQKFSLWLCRQGVEEDSITEMLFRVAENYGMTDEPGRDIDTEIDQLIIWSQKAAARSP